MYLNKVAPLLKMAGSGYTEGLCSLSRTPPFWLLSANAIISNELLTLVKKVTLWKLTSSLYTSGVMSLSEFISTYSFEGTCYCNSAVLEEYIPLAHIIDAILDETEIAGSVDDDVTSSYFSGVLRYIRP
jgi:hypothetical protein